MSSVDFIRIHDAPQDQDFLRDVSHVPNEIPDDRASDFSEIRSEANPPGAPGAAPATGWTAEEIADLFAGCFTTLTCARIFIPVGGAHWNIPREHCMRLGNAWLPIFIKHVPYESRPSWMPDFLLYVTVIGTTRDVIGPALAEEIRLQRGGKQQPQKQPVTIDAEPQPSTTAETTTASTETATSPESSASAESASQGKQPSSGWKSNLQTID